MGDGGLRDGIGVGVSTIATGKAAGQSRALLRGNCHGAISRHDDGRCIDNAAGGMDGVKVF